MDEEELEEKRGAILRRIDAMTDEDEMSQEEALSFLEDLLGEIQIRIDGIEGDIARDK